MSDGMSTRQLQSRLRELREDRAWKEFHQPRSLVLAMLAELGELADVVAWQRDDHELSAVERQAIADELADVATYALHLADVLNLDLGEEVERKLEETRRRFADLPPGTASRKDRQE